MVYSLRQFTAIIVVLSYITIWDMGTWLYVLHYTNRRSCTSQAATATPTYTRCVRVNLTHIGPKSYIRRSFFSLSVRTLRKIRIFDKPLTKTWKNSK